MFSCVDVKTDGGRLMADTGGAGVSPRRVATAGRNWMSWAVEQSDCSGRYHLHGCGWGLKLLYVEATLQGIAAEGGRRGFGDRPAEEDDFQVSPGSMSAGKVRGSQLRGRIAGS